MFFLLSKDDVKIVVLSNHIAYLEKLAGRGRLIARKHNYMCLWDVCLPFLSKAHDLSSVEQQVVICTPLLKRHHP